MDHGKHVVRDKKQYIAYTSTLYSKPVEITHYWPIGSAVNSWIGCNLEDLETDFEVRACNGGNFRSPGGWLFSLKDGGKTKPDFSEQVNLLPPKTKMQTEYRDGSWYKILRSGKRIKAEGRRDEKSRCRLSS
jgi:hypothetical protein